MAFEELIQEMNRRKEKALSMGGPEKLEKRRAEGVMNARERIDYLLDGGSFVESGLLATSVREEVRHKAHADGKLAGIGKIDGRHVALVSNDFTVMGASSAATNMKKIRHMKKISCRQGIPLILLGESTGARMPDRMGAEGRATLGQDATEYQRFREAPMVSALLGQCYGSSTWYTCMSDFNVMRKGAKMAVASDRVTSIAIAEPIDPEELGGWKLHAETTGLIDAVAETDEEALDVIRTYLSYLPSNAQEPPPEYPVPEGSDEAIQTVLDILPESKIRVYDMRNILRVIFDKDSLFELKSAFGQSIVTAFARLGGKSVGIIANNPAFKGGAMDVDAIRKATSFLVHCDSFNIPILMFVDQPGFLIGVDGERRAAPGRIINWMNALTLVTVPKLTVMVRKNYGQGYLNMGGGRNSDEVLLWPTVDLGFMDPVVGVNVLYNVRQEDDPERFKQLHEELTRDTGPWNLAGLYEAQMVIDPRETRSVLLRLLEVYRKGANNGVGEHLLRNWPTSY
jgi:acetyl-CoA carboxylase carboxyltransferase component